ncbi:50S small subunit ribosomal protein L7/L12 [Cryptococcus wingfieldii CBS 7118]|uniref:50S small subunit ribosomal protein L7/L12 n=1 Tax=Cryptococcus wingfieldii CBS 7118 TaxID=1295528 RepID=A0A1E3HX26_9TREE|nr:50S small subunit ribosomal protein L7/L12 [Cryptococcus wingfieldii CBS 7118]ODN80326.1 50S small subunit ribosomal protein L7/L12 [Cryptococcus wingfieldii CBS 7118]
MSLSRSLLRSARPIASSSRQALRSFSSSRPSYAEPDAEAAAPVSPKIAPIVETISTLSLLEVSELVSALKTRLNITEIAMPAASAPAAPSAAAEAPVEEKPKEKTIFTVKLEKFDAAAKAKIIREVKAMMPNMNLVEVSVFMLFGCLVEGLGGFCEGREKYVDEVGEMWGVEGGYDRWTKKPCRQGDVACGG